MPPSQHMLASKLRGFVCRSCTSKLQPPRQQRTPLALRNYSSAVATQKGDQKDGKQKSAAREQKQAEPDINFYDQTPDGNRTAVPKEDAEERALREEVEREVRKEEERSGQSVEEMIGIMTGDQKDVEEAMQRNMQRILRDGLGDMGLGPSEEQWAKMEEAEKKIDDANDVIASYGGIKGIKNLSDEEKLKVREKLLAPMRKAMAKARYVPKVTSNTSKIHLEESSLGVSTTSRATRPRDIVLTRESLLLPVEAFPVHAQDRITQLNNALFPTTRRSIGRRKRPGVQPKALKPKDTIHEIWRAYILCRKSLIDGSEHVPHRIWQALWNKLAEEGPHNPDRMGHIKYLGDDMKRSCVPLTPHQHLLYIEALYIDDDRNLAIQAWEDVKLDSEYHLERLHSSYTNKRSFQLSYWELGIRMFSINGQAEKAFEAAEVLFNLTKDPGAYRTLLPILQAYLKDKEQRTPQRAWALYVQMRLRLGSTITMEDYDNIIAAFMDANQPYLALGVFKDMMITGKKSLADRDSVAPYRTALNTNAGLASQVKLAELGWQDEKVLGKLPARYNNKFFFGSWIKKLIGDQELEIAKKVFDLMADRRIVPSPIHLNGLVGAWLRGGFPRQQKMAEDTAWRMIKARIDFVEKRKKGWTRGWVFDGPVRTVETFYPGDLRNEDVSLTPHATIETFMILIQQYRVRQRDDLTMTLYSALQKAEVKASPAFLNELLLSNPKTHFMSWKWKAYREMTETNQCRPDVETYTTLWSLFAGARNGKKYRGKKAYVENPHGPTNAVDPLNELAEFNQVEDPEELDMIHGKDPFERVLPDVQTMPTAQELFGDMVYHLTSTALWPKITKQLYDSIIIAFSIAEDQIGTAVALRALRRKFNMLPTSDTVRMVVYQLTRVGMKPDLFTEEPTQRRAATQERISKVAEILESLRRDRYDALVAQGIDPRQLNDIAKLEETEMLLSDFLKYAARVQNKKDFDLAEASRDAAECMNVPDCVPWEARN